MAGVGGAGALGAETLCGKAVDLWRRRGREATIHFKRHAAPLAAQFMKRRGSQSNSPHLKEVPVDLLRAHASRPSMGDTTGSLGQGLLIRLTAGC